MVVLSECFLGKGEGAGVNFALYYIHLQFQGVSLASLRGDFDNGEILTIFHPDFLIIKQRRELRRENAEMQKCGIAEIQKSKIYLYFLLLSVFHF